MAPFARNECLLTLFKKLPLFIRVREKRIIGVRYSTGKVRYVP